LVEETRRKPPTCRKLENNWLKTNMTQQIKYKPRQRIL
jgi:hypothetical protein